MSLRACALRPMLATATALTFMSASSVGQADTTSASNTSAETQQKRQLETSFRTIFSEGLDERWYIADYSFPSPFYRAGWVAENVRLTAESMGLFINSIPTEFQPYSGAEIQRIGWFHFGRYEVIMKPAGKSGLISSFFVYTGQSYGDPQDEIDIEFPGNRPTQVHPNMFINGKPRNPPDINLGFDASESFNLYAFEWEPDSVSWFVNDQKVLTVEAPRANLPQTPGIIMANIWTGSPGQFGWHGPRRFEDDTNAQYKCMSYRAPGDTEAKQCSDTELMDDILSARRG